MDILAARKKAAEKAKAAHTGPAEPARPAAEQHEPERPAPPPASETTQTPDEPAKAKEPAPAPESTVAAPVSGETASAEGGETQEQELEMLSFLLGSEEYVVPVDRVIEVLTPREITPVPRTPDYLMGVCSLRGTVMPIIDLNRRLGLAESKRDEKSRIIVISLGQDEQAGLYVDRVRGVARFLPSAVRPAPENVEQSRGAEYLKGIARKDARLFILLDVEKAIGA